MCVIELRNLGVRGLPKGSDCVHVCAFVECGTTGRTEVGHVFLRSLPACLEPKSTSRQEMSRIQTHTHTHSHTLALLWSQPTDRT